MGTDEKPNLEQDVRDNYRFWNEGQRAARDQLFRRLGPNGITIEYVSAPALEGGEAMAQMWEQYGGRCTTEIKELIVNGDQAAAYVHNHLQTETGLVSVPSIETYAVTNGVLRIRYFHRAAH